MGQGYKKNNNIEYDKNELASAISDYDIAWTGYQAYGWFRYI